MSDFKPIVAPVQIGNIPSELKTLERWVLWRFIKKQNKKGIKWDKVPFTVHGSNASTTNPATWDTFSNVEKAYLAGGFDGLGIVIHGPEFQGIDADDCIDPLTGELNGFGQEILDSIEGYAEYSPSELGFKIFTKTNLQTSNVKPELELYVGGRYFTVTGNVIAGHENFTSVTQNLDWLVTREFGETPLASSSQADANAIINLKAPLIEWDLDRVRDELLSCVEAECSYSEWIGIGMALHHQGQGDAEWLELWDDWSQAGSTYVEGECERKWDSFNKQRASGKGPKTLRHLLEITRNQRQLVASNLVDDLCNEINQVSVAAHLETVLAKKIAQHTEFTDVDRERLARELQNRAIALNLKLQISTIRNWLKPKVFSAFPHTSADGNPLCTIENLNVLLQKMGTHVRYNVMSKQIEILIANEGYTQDNHFNASLGRIISEASRYCMPTKHIPLFLIQIADQNQFNPMLSWIQSKPWDGISRLDDLANSIESPMNPAFKKALLSKWMKQAVGAAFEPNGIAPQGVLVFQGEQYKGKTRWFQALVRPRSELALTGHTLDVKSKDSVFVGMSYWLVELGELDGTFSRSEIAALKSHITQERDKIRRPYAPAESVFPRRTVYFASVNEGQFLHDPTGNRRFWVIPVTGINHNHGIDMQQLWAEMLVLYQADPTFYLSGEEMLTLNSTNQQFTSTDPIEERIEGAFDWFEKPVWTWATATDVLIRCGIQNPTKAQAMIASRVIRRLNGDQHRKSNGRNLLAIPQSRSQFIETSSELEIG